MRDNTNPDQIGLFDTVENRNVIKRERERERRILSCHIYNTIISVENLLVSWQEFLKGKRKRKDVSEFSIHLMDNIFRLHEELKNKMYRHGPYQGFKISDPKPRHIHKAPVRDRFLHHAIHRILYPYFDRKFLFDSYSCRTKKGTHRGINRFTFFAGKVSQNNTRTAWILKCDIRKFFANIDHSVLKKILRKYIRDKSIVWLLDQVIESYNSPNKQGVGLPLGNLTSQLLINIYMNELDHFVKRELKILYYIRYADDFIIVHENREILVGITPQISIFLEENLKLKLHPDKVFIKTFYSGVDFLGWVLFPHHRILRTTTLRRILKRLKKEQSKESLVSYSGLLSHGNTYKIIRKIEKRLLEVT